MSDCRIIRDGEGLGGYLCPPGHPNHTYVIRSGTGPNAGCYAISYALTLPYIPADVKDQARHLLASAQITAPEEWIRAVYAHFRYCYAPENGCRDVSSLISDSSGALPADRHLAVLRIRDYLPDHQPRLDLI